MTAAIPTVIMQLRGDGNVTRMRVREEREPRPPSFQATPEPPEHFDDEQRRVWFEEGDRLARIGLLTEADMTALELFVCEKLRNRELQILARHASGLFLKGRDGTCEGARSNAHCGRATTF